MIIVDNSVLRLTTPVTVGVEKHKKDLLSHSVGFRR